MYNTVDVRRTEQAVGWQVLSSGTRSSATKTFGSNASSSDASGSDVSSSDASGTKSLGSTPSGPTAPGSGTFGETSSPQCDGNEPFRWLSDSQLIARADQVARSEHEAGLHLLDALLEMERRSLCLELGYSSLFDYCTRKWLFSRSKAGRYIAVARATRRHPVLRQLLERRSLTIGNAAILVGVLTDGNNAEVLTRAAGRTYAEIEEIVSSLKPAREVRDLIRPIGHAPTRNGAGTDGIKGVTGQRVAELDRVEGRPAEARAGEHTAEENAATYRQGVEAADFESRSRSAVGEDAADSEPGSADAIGTDAANPLSDDSQTGTRYQIRFSASSEFTDKLDRARRILSSRASLEDVFGALLDEFLERRDPARREARRTTRCEARRTAQRKPRRAARRQARQEAECGARSKQRSGGRIAPVEEGRIVGRGGDDLRWRDVEDGAQNPARCNRVDDHKREGDPGDAPRTSPRRRSRHIPARVRDAVFARDGGRCTYVGDDGVPCRSTRHLQIDHIVPFSRGGDHSIENLRLLCGQHNRFEASRVLETREQS